MRLNRSLGLTGLMTLLLAGSGALAATSKPVAFTGNDNIDATLFVSGPSGDFTTTNGFATPFSIPASGDNFSVVSSGDPLSITGLSIAGATDVFTLIDASSPVAGDTFGAVSFSFSDGTFETVDLVAGGNVRDYYDGSFANTVTDSYVENAFTYTDTQGGAGTGNASTGLIGTYRIDEQDFALGSFADGKVLSGITFASVGGDDGSPLVLGVTVESVPEPSTWTMLLVGFAGMGALVRRRAGTFA
jgi:hypothetical protein